MLLHDAHEDTKDGLNIPTPFPLQLRAGQEQALGAEMLIGTFQLMRVPMNGAGSLPGGLPGLPTGFPQLPGTGAVTGLPSIG